jgi:hypothetical protein
MKSWRMGLPVFHLFAMMQRSLAVPALPSAYVRSLYAMVMLIVREAQTRRNHCAVMVMPAAPVKPTSSNA